MRALYGGVLLPLALALALPAALFHKKLRETLLARRGVWGRLAEAAAGRDPARRLVWFHVASAGELLQAEPVIRRCGEAGAQAAVTLTSVSALDWTARLRTLPGVIWADVMPLDFPWAVRRVWRALRPALLVHVQAELWPGLVWEAEALGTPQILIAARVGARSFRLRNALGRAFYRALYRPLLAIEALSEADRARLERIVPGHPALEAAGDPGIETALARVREAAKTGAAALPPGFDRAAAPLLVVGSAWPADERRLLPVLTQALEAIPALKAIVAPHEPDEAHLAALERAFAAFGTVRLSQVSAAGKDARDAEPHPPTPSPLRSAQGRLGEGVSRNGKGEVARSGQPLHPGTPRIVLVDSVGRLAALYGAGTCAYVGGGFSTGVHNVAEPAAAGLPVLFGPRHSNSAVAQVLLEQGAAFACEGAGELGLALLPLLREPARAAQLGARARATVEAMAGAAERAFQTIRELAGL